MTDRVEINPDNTEKTLEQSLCTERLVFVLTDIVLRLWAWR